MGRNNKKKAAAQLNLNDPEALKVTPLTRLLAPTPQLTCFLSIAIEQGQRRVPEGELPGGDRHVHEGDRAQLEQCYLLLQQ